MVPCSDVTDDTEAPKRMSSRLRKSVFPEAQLPCLYRFPKILRPMTNEASCVVGLV